MPLTIICFATYLMPRKDEADGPVLDWRQEDYDANKFIKAIKGDPIKGFAHIPVCGTSYRLEERNRHDAFTWFGRMAAARLHRTHPQLLADQLALVPVPSSIATVGVTGPFAPQRLAQCLASALGENAILDDILRWDQPMQSARAGGSRDPQYLHDHLVRTDGVYTDIPYVLVDDVCTSAGHLQACAAQLREAGASVELALCGGLTVYAQDYEPFAVPDRVEPHFTPARRLF